MGSEIDQTTHIVVVKSRASGRLERLLSYQVRNLQEANKEPTFIEDKLASLKQRYPPSQHIVGYGMAGSIENFMTLFPEFGNGLDTVAPYTEESELRRFLESNNIPLTAKIEEALKIVRKVHQGQKRDDGTDYLNEHVFPVTVGVINYFLDEYLDEPDFERAVCTSLLHDVIETDPEMRTEVFHLFGNDLYLDIDALTKKEADKSQGSRRERERRKTPTYLRKISNASVYAQITKLVDRENNLECIGKTDSEDKKRSYFKETSRHYIPFAKEISPSLHYRIAHLNQILGREIL